MSNSVKPGIEDTLLIVDSCLMHVKASMEWFTRQVLPLSLRQLRWRPDPRSWSVIECMEHLNLTLGSYLPRIDEAICLGRREGRTSRESPRYTRSERAALLRVEPPVTLSLV